jgi:hypothetical protein
MMIDFSSSISNNYSALDTQNILFSTAIRQNSKEISVSPETMISHHVINPGHPLIKPNSIEFYDFRDVSAQGDIGYKINIFYPYKTTDHEFTSKNYFPSIANAVAHLPYDIGGSETHAYILAGNVKDGVFTIDGKNGNSNSSSNFELGSGDVWKSGDKDEKLSDLIKQGLEQGLEKYTLEHVSFNKYAKRD